MSDMFHKVTLDSGKVVFLRPLQVRHYKLAAEAGAHKAEGNQTVAAMYIQDELLKLLLVQIDDKKLDPIQKEKFEDLFEPPEYRQVNMVIEEMVGKVKKPKVEIVSSLSGVKSPGSPDTAA